MTLGCSSRLLLSMSNEQPQAWEPPEWLRQALEEDRKRPPMPKPKQAPIRPGDIRLATGGGVSAYVLVHEAVQDHHTYYHTGTHETQQVPSYLHVQCTMLSNDVDLVTDDTAVLDTSFTGLPFKLLATGLCGSLFPSQLSGRYGRLPLKLTRGLWGLVVGRREVFRHYPNLHRGMPLSGRSDWRWDEIVNMLTEEWQPLSGDAMCAMLADLDGEPHPPACPCSVCAKV